MVLDYAIRILVIVIAMKDILENYVIIVILAFIMIPTHAQVNKYSNKTFVRYGKYFVIPKSSRAPIEAKINQCHFEVSRLIEKSQGKFL